VSHSNGDDGDNDDDDQAVASHARHNDKRNGGKVGALSSHPRPSSPAPLFLLGHSPRQYLGLPLRAFGHCLLWQTQRAAKQKALWLQTLTARFANFFELTDGVVRLIPMQDHDDADDEGDDDDDDDDDDNNNKKNKGRGNGGRGVFVAALPPSSRPSFLLAEPPPDADADGGPERAYHRDTEGEYLTSEGLHTRNTEGEYLTSEGLTSEGDTAQESPYAMPAALRVAAAAAATTHLDDADEAGGRGGSSGGGGGGGGGGGSGRGGGDDGAGSDGSWSEDEDDKRTKIVKSIKIRTGPAPQSSAEDDEEALRVISTSLFSLASPASASSPASSSDGGVGGGRARRESSEDDAFDGSKSFTFGQTVGGAAASGSSDDPFSPQESQRSKTMVMPSRPESAASLFGSVRGTNHHACPMSRPFVFTFCARRMRLNLAWCVNTRLSACRQRVSH
jgi:uncharacterized membrane protein YgcG